MNRQTGAARISIAPTKAKGASVWRSLLECVSLAAGFVLLRLTADGLYGQLAFGLFVGALYCNRLLAPSVLFLATSFASGIDCVLVSAVQCAVMLGVSFVHIKCRRKINKWLLILYLAASQIFFVLFKTSESQELVNKLIAAGAGIVFSFVCIYVLRALFIRGLKYRLTVEENICLAVFALCVFKALDLIRVGGVGLLAFIAPLAVLLTLFVYGKSACYALAATIGFACALNAGSLTQVAVKVAFGACAFAVRGGSCIFFRYLRRLQQPEIDCGGSVLRGFLLHTRQNSRISQSGFRQHQGKILPAPHSQPSARQPKSKAF